MNSANETQAGLLEDAIRIGLLQAEIVSLETMLDDPQSAWNLQQTQFQANLDAARKNHAEQQALAAAAEAQRQARLIASRPLLQNAWESFVSQANADELLIMADRDKTYGIGWWLDIPSPFFLDLSRDPVKALVSSMFRALRLARFESHLRYKKSRLSQFRLLKKFPNESGILTFLETSESKSFGLRNVLTRRDAEAGVNFMLALSALSANQSHQSQSLTKENSHDASNYR